MSHQFVVTADLSSAEDVDFTKLELLRIPGVTVIEHLPVDRLQWLTQALSQVDAARNSESQDRLLNALTYALTVACSLVPGAP